MLMMRVLEVKPLLEELGLGHYSVVVNLISTAQHRMEWSSLMAVEHITPQRVRAGKIGWTGG